MNSSRYPGLDLGRFVAALIVALGHLLFIETPIRAWALNNSVLIPFRFGSLSVAFFFGLSGFVLSTQLSLIRRRPVRWTMSRLSRLLPVYYFAWLIPMTLFILIARRNGGAIFPDGKLSAFLGFFFSQSWTINHYIDMPNPPLWTLSVEIWFSFILVIIGVLALKRFVLLLIALILIVAQVFGSFHLNPIIDSLPLFLLGIVVNSPHLIALCYKKALRISLCIILLTTLVFIVRDTLTGAFSFYFVILQSIFVVCLLLLFSTFNLKGKSLAFSEFLSSRTYSLYAVHFPLLIIMSRIFVSVNQVNPFVWIFTMTALILIVTEIAYKFIERPSLALSRSFRNSSKTFK